MKALLFLSLISTFLVLGVLSTNSSVSGSPNDQNTTANPTTTATTTTTTLPPTPTTTEPPRPGDYNVSQCLRLKALIRIDTSSGHKYVPSNAATNGTCNQNKSTLTISWNNEDSVTFIFSNDNSTVYLKDVTVKLSNNSQEQGVNMKLSSAETFYECSATAMKIGNYNVTLNSLKVQAFHYNSTFSGNGENCDAPKPTPTTTPAVTTVTQGPVSTTTVKPSLATNNYTISGSVNGTNVTCLLMNAAIEFNIPYEGKTENKTYKGFIGKSPSVQGSCEITTDSLKITTTGITLEFTFKNNDQKYSLSELKLVADTKNFPDGKDMKIISDYTNNKTFQLQVGDYYSCKSKTTLDLSSNVKVFITNLQLEAFRNSSTSMIDGKMVLCPGDQKTNSIVPIAVGAALAGLVVVVLIAYLIGRKRSRRGYESV